MRLGVYEKRPRGPGKNYYVVCGMMRRQGGRAAGRETRCRQSSWDVRTHGGASPPESLWVWPTPVALGEPEPSARALRADAREHAPGVEAVLAVTRVATGAAVVCVRACVRPGGMATRKKKKKKNRVGRTDSRGEQTCRFISPYKLSRDGRAECRRAYDSAPCTCGVDCHGGGIRTCGCGSSKSKEGKEGKPTWVSRARALLAALPVPPSPPPSPPPPHPHHHVTNQPSLRTSRPC